MSVAVEVRSEDWSRHGLYNVLGAGGPESDPSIHGSLIHPDDWLRVKAELDASGLPYRFKAPGQEGYTSVNGADWGE